MPQNLPRPAYIALRFLFDLLACLSRLLNATVFAGSTHQTTSARAYIEGLTDPVWAARRDRIDRLIFWQADHCREQWLYDVERARETLRKNHAIANPSIVTPEARPA
ncbi:hypothetical protein EBL89_06745 [Cereibacter sphaeroides]|uniref:hypothetical protein n=1 Tax=Cereibacter sphaeroides TaxID=1063 RepID=UPI000F532932|nr:hypothetical protein [Cereibacter sphaeroides]AZB55023.1 hypothetical protein EBL89_06745 [Cereibacter sphaeroides]AZB59279.1 hypothetical protein EBL88_06685 [Cereibacter sphaeroides]